MEWSLGDFKLGVVLETPNWSGVLGTPNWNGVLTEHMNRGVFQSPVVPLCPAVPEVAQSHVVT